MIRADVIEDMAQKQLASDIKGAKAQLDKVRPQISVQDLCKRSHFDA